MAHILPDSPFAGPFAWCEHGTPLGHRCQFCRTVTSAQPTTTGWECPRCHRVWNPAVLACQHCPEPPAFIAKDAP